MQDSDTPSSLFWLNPVHFQVQDWKIEKIMVNSEHFLFFYFCARKFVISLHPITWRYDVKKMTLFDQVHIWSSIVKKKIRALEKKIDLFHVLSICWWAQDNEKRLQAIASTWILSVRISSKVLWQQWLFETGELTKNLKMEKGNPLLIFVEDRGTDDEIRQTKDSHWFRPSESPTNIILFPFIFRKNSSPLNLYHIKIKHKSNNYIHGTKNVKQKEDPKELNTKSCLRYLGSSQLRGCHLYLR